MTIKPKSSKPKSKPMPRPKARPVQTPLSEVRGKVAFITGGSSGIGLGLGKVLSAAGMKVVFTYMNEKHRDSALAQFPKGNPGVHAIRLNTTDREGMVRAADEAERVFGNVHLLVNNAGVGVADLTSKVSWEDWDWALDVNINGVFNGVRTFLPRMQKHGEGGHIMVTSSAAGIVAGPLGVYVTTKFAVVGMFEALRTELGGTNIGVSIFCPGLVRTQIFDAQRNRPDSHGTKGAPPAPPPLSHDGPPVDLMGVAMDPIEAAEYVLAGIRRNDLYILSHPEFKSMAAERCALLLDSFSRKPVPRDRGHVSGFLRPDIYEAEATKKKAALRKKPKSGVRAKAKPRAKARARNR
jgi:NAD(P)-dependent dehydrogenase (short-subunit alcohol dehydrogenase family)